MAETKLIFRTTVGSDTISANTRVTLVSGLIVKNYPEIRLLCGSRVSSKSPILLNIVLLEGDESLGSLDTIVLQPHEGYTSVYPIPGTKIAILATAGDGDAYIDLFVYGYDPSSRPKPCSSLCN